jgi:mannose-6-phosphate isomerase-like protein (cupin superfamily)
MTEDGFEGFVQQPHEGTRIRRRDSTIRVVVPSGRSAASSAMELEVRPGFQTSLHSHDTVEEILYVLSGRLDFSCGDGTVAVGEGGCVVLPAGLPHRFRNPGPDTARLLMIGAPPSLDLYFAQVAELEDGDEPALAELQRRHGVTIHRPAED